MEGIESGVADTDSNGVITVDELHEYAKRKVQEAAPAMKPEIFAVKEGYKIVLAKALLGDPKLEYRKEVEQLAQERDGQLSNIVLQGLDVKRKQLHLPLEEAETIRIEVLQPYRDFEEKCHQYEQAYEQTWREAIQQKTLLSKAISEDLQYLQQVLGLRDEDIAPIHTRVTSEQFTTLLKMIQSETGMKAENLVKCGLDKYNAGNFQEAIADYNQAIKLLPNYAHAYFHRGVARSASDDKQAAIRDYNQVIKLQPDAADAYIGRGDAHSALGDKQAAIHDYQKAANLSQQQGKTEESQNALNRIKALQE